MPKIPHVAKSSEWFSSVITPFPIVLEGVYKIHYYNLVHKHT
jgi:hypothetical protein